MKTTRNKAASPSAALHERTRVRPAPLQHIGYGIRADAAASASTCTLSRPPSMHELSQQVSSMDLVQGSAEGQVPAAGTRAEQDCCPQRGGESPQRRQPQRIGCSMKAPSAMLVPRAAPTLCCDNRASMTSGHPIAVRCSGAANLGRPPVTEGEACPTFIDSSGEIMEVLLCCRLTSRTIQTPSAFCMSDDRLSTGDVLRLWVPEWQHAAISGELWQRSAWRVLSGEHLPCRLSWRSVPGVALTR